VQLGQSQRHVSSSLLYPMAMTMARRIIEFAVTSVVRQARTGMRNTATQLARRHSKTFVPEGGNETNHRACCNLGRAASPNWNAKHGHATGPTTIKNPSSTYYIYTYTCAYTYTHIHIDTYTCTDLHTHTHAHTHSHRHAHAHPLRHKTCTYKVHNYGDVHFCRKHPHIST
jgi:hypothetical protein